MERLSQSPIATFIPWISASPQDGAWLDRWANTVSSGVLAVLVLATLSFRPFTEDYAREQTPPEVWDTPGFRRTNQVITLVWGGVFVGTAILGAIAASSPSSSDWTNWILPIALIVGGFKFTQRYPEVVRERARSGAAQSPHADVPEPPTPAGAR